MSEPIDTFEHAGLTIKLYHDDDRGESPREWSNVGTMSVDYKGYTLGDADAPDPREKTATCPKCDGEGYVPFDGDPGNTRYDDGTMVCQNCGGEGEVPVDIATFLRRECGARVILPLYVYEHGGITMSAGARIAEAVTRRDIDPRGRNPFDTAAWDTSMVGFIYDTPEAVKECMGEDATDEQIEACLRSEVETYDDFLTGQVYGYVIEDADGEHVDSLWGMYENHDKTIWDDDGYVRTEAKSSAEHHAHERAQATERETNEAAFWAARDVVTIP